MYVYDKIYWPNIISIKLICFLWNLVAYPTISFPVYMLQYKQYE